MHLEHLIQIMEGLFVFVHSIRMSVQCMLIKINKAPCNNVEFYGKSVLN